MDQEKGGSFSDSPMSSYLLHGETVYEVLCNVVDMNAYHFILGRPWQYDVEATHRGKENFYVFFKNGKKIVIGPINKGNVPKTYKMEGKPSLLLVNNGKEFDKVAKELKQIFAIVITDGEPKLSPKVPSTVQLLIKEFEEPFPEELPAGLPSMREPDPTRTSE